MQLSLGDDWLWFCVYYNISDERIIKQVRERIGEANVEDKKEDYKHGLEAQVQTSGDIYKIRPLSDVPDAYKKQSLVHEDASVPPPSAAGPPPPTNFIKQKGMISRQ